jgi:hypothetical protein
VAVDSNGTVFLGNGWNGLRAYNYNGSSFTNIAHIDSGFAGGIGGIYGGYIFVMSGEINGNWLDAYHYEDSTFTLSGSTDLAVLINTFKGHVVGPDGTIFAAKRMNLLAYTYDGFSFDTTAYIHYGYRGKGVAVGDDGTVFTANRGDGRLLMRSYQKSRLNMCFYKIIPIRSIPAQQLNSQFPKMRLSH